MFSKEKVKNKRGGQKHRFKSTTSAQSTISTNELPEDFGFLWSIDPLVATYDEKYPRRYLGVGSSKGNDVARLWFPPNRAKMITRRTGNLYRWSMGESQLVDDMPRPEKKVEVASVFFQAKQDNFVATLKDCTQHNIVDEDVGWSYIGFRHNSGNLSEVDVGGERFLLAAPADGSSWMPQVLPKVYNYDTKSPSAREFRGAPGGLCGRLSLLIAMAAFSAEVNHAEAVVSHCFGVGEWRKHQFATGIGRMCESPSSEHCHRFNHFRS
jgi:hypothetical protein